MGDFNGATFCDSDGDAVLFINITLTNVPIMLTLPSDIGVCLALRLALDFSVTVMVVKLAFLPCCSLLECHK